MLQNPVALDLEHNFPLGILDIDVQQLASGERDARRAADHEFGISGSDPTHNLRATRLVRKIVSVEEIERVA